MTRFLRQIWNAFKISFAMYSKIPMPKTEWTEENMKYSMCFFPLVGAVIGALIYGFSCLASAFSIEGNFYTAILLLIPVLVSGGLHLDGLLDTADAMSSYQTRERRLEILKDSNSGAFAVITCVCYFLLAFGVWSQVNGEMLPILCAGFILSRCLSGISIVTFRCARNTGLAVAFAGPAHKKAVRTALIVILLACLLFCFWRNWFYALWASLAALISFWYYRRLSYRNFGGITGDLAGFFLQVCELAMPLFLVVADIFFRR